MINTPHPFKIGTTNPGLISGGRKDDSQAWEEIVSRYSPLIYHWARQHGMQPAEAANIVQETRLSVAGQLQAFEARSGKGSFRSWLKTIVLNKIRSFYRKKKNQGQVVGGTDWQKELGEVPDPALLPSTGSGDSGPPNQALEKALEQVRSQVSENTFRAFSLQFFEGWSSPEVAEELGMTPHAVRMAKVRVLKKLRAYYGQHSDKDESP